LIWSGRHAHTHIAIQGSGEECPGLVTIDSSGCDAEPVSSV
jgi:hypothetical protein